MRRVGSPDQRATLSRGKDAVKQQPLTREEFTDKVGQDKIGLLDRLAGDIYEVGYKLAEASVEYYKMGGRYGKGEEFQAAQGRKADLEWKYETLRHVISALQSTLKAERIGVTEQP